jgi:hypothetical protein
MPMVKEKINFMRNPVPGEGFTRDDSPRSLLIDSIDRFELEPDGKHLAVHSDRSVLTFHCSVFRELLAMLPPAIMQSERLLQQTPHVNFAMSCEGWELGAIDNGNSLILTFRLHGGANVSFCLPREQIPPMVDALISAARLVPIPQQASGPLQ